MYLKFVVLLAFLCLPHMADAGELRSQSLLKQRVAATRCGLAAAVPGKPLIPKTDVPILKSLQERLRLDRGNGLSYSFLRTRSRGFFFPATEVFIGGQYKWGRPGLGIGFRF